MFNKELLESHDIIPAFMPVDLAQLNRLYLKMPGTLLPYICGAAESTNVFALADALPEFYLMIDRGAKVFTYAGCRISKATFTGTKGDLLFLELDIEAETETIGNAGTFIPLTNPQEKPFIMEDGVLTLQGETRVFEKFSLTIENVLNTELFGNNLILQDI